MARRKPPVIADQLLDQLLAGADAKRAFEKDGLLDELKKALAERALNAEIDHHLETGEADGRTNSRNGYGEKRVLTESGRIALEVPRDRLSTFDPQLIAKYQRRFPGFDEKIISMYARGMSTREIQGHLRELYGIDVSPDLVSAVTDAVLDEVTEWQNRPLEALYPLIFFDAIRIKVRDEGTVRNKAVYGRARRPPGRDEGNPGTLDRTDRGRQILAPRHERAEEPRRRGRADRHRRWPEGLPGSDHRRLSAGAGADLCRPSHPPLAGLRLVQGSQGGCRGIEANLQGKGRRCRQTRPRRLCRRRMGQEISGHRPVLAAELVGSDPVLRVSRRCPPDHLHHKFHRKLECQAAPGGQNEGTLSYRRERAQAPLPGVEPGRERMENATSRMEHGQGTARHSVRRPFYLGVITTVLTRNS